MTIIRDGESDTFQLHDIQGKSLSDLVDQDPFGIALVTSLKKFSG